MWVEMNQESPSSRSGTWIEEIGPTALVVDFLDPLLE